MRKIKSIFRKELFDKVWGYICENRFFILICFSVFFIPLSGIYPIRGTSVWYVQFLGILTIMYLMMCMELWIFNKYLASFVILSWFNYIFVANQDFRTLWISIALLLASLMIKKISEFNSKQRKIIFYFMLGLFIIQAGWVILQYLNIDPIFDFAGNKAEKLDDTVGISGNHNQVGLFFADITPLVFRFLPWLIPFLVFGLWNSTTTAAWAGFLVAGGYIIWRMNKKTFMLFIAFIMFCSMIFFTRFEDFNSITVKERVLLYKHTAQAITKGNIRITVQDMNGTKIQKVVTCSPWFGFGLGNFMRISPLSQLEYNNRLKQHQHVYRHAHNDLLEVFFEMGWTGLISILLVIANFIIRFLRARKTEILVLSFAGVMAHLVTSMGIFTVHTAVSGMMLILYLGIVFGELRDQNI